MRTERARLVQAAAPGSLRRLALLAHALFAATPTGERRTGDAFSSALSVAPEQRLVVSVFWEAICYLRALASAVALPPPSKRQRSRPSGAAAGQPASQAGRKTTRPAAREPTARASRRAKKTALTARDDHQKAESAQNFAQNC